MSYADRALFRGLEARRLTQEQAVAAAEALREVDRSMPNQSQMTAAARQELIRGIPVVGGAIGTMRNTNPETIDFDVPPHRREDVEPPAPTRSPLVSHPDTPRGPERWTHEMGWRMFVSRLPEHADRPARRERSTGWKITEEDLA